MGLKDEVADDQHKPRTRTLDKIMLKLPKEDAKDLKEMLEDSDNFTHSSIARVLTKRGFPVSEQVVRRHRGYLAADQRELERKD